MGNAMPEALGPYTICPVGSPRTGKPLCPANLAAMAQHILLTGAPGCGKTTVIRRVVERLRASGAPLFGFWTEDLRERGRRAGFAMETVEGKRGVLAHEDFKSGPRVSRYRVDVPAFERLAVAEIERALASAEGVLVVDEIGKMELFSDAFTRAIAAAFDSPLRVLATIMQKPNAFADGIKARKDVAIIVATPANRDALAEEILGTLMTA